MAPNSYGIPNGPQQCNWLAMAGAILELMKPIQLCLNRLLEVWRSRSVVQHVSARLFCISAHYNDTQSLRCTHMGYPDVLMVLQLIPRYVKWIRSCI
jgi:hypothetical protein